MATEKAAVGIYEAMALAMADVEAVSKSRKNEQQGFKFRGIDDVYNVVHSALADHGIVTPPRVLERVVAERQTKSGSVQLHVTIKVEYDFTARDGSKMTVGPIYAEALDTSDKATNKALSFAHKYTLLQTFCIPTEDIAEGDRTTIEAAPKKGAAAIPSKALPPAQQKLADAQLQAWGDDKLIEEIHRAEEWIKGLKSADPRAPKALSRLQIMKDELESRIDRNTSEDAENGVSP